MLLPQPLECPLAPWVLSVLYTSGVCPVIREAFGFIYAYVIEMEPDIHCIQKFLNCTKIN